MKFLKQVRDCFLLNKEQNMIKKFVEEGKKKYGSYIDDE